MPRYLPVRHAICSQQAQSPHASLISTASAWTTAAGQVYCTMHNSSLYRRHSLCLLLQSLPLLSLTSLDAQQVKGGEPMTNREGRRGLRGGASAPSPASKPNQQRMTLPGRLPLVLLLLPLRPPHSHKLFLLLHPSRQHGHKPCHHSWLPRRGNGPIPKLSNLSQQSCCGVGQEKANTVFYLSSAPF
jgi:hypothetical protein